jgi:CelD/BcsL family acetyltransferase involved in cellulose biosynthesis
MLTVQKITSRDDFSRLQPLWDDLLSSSSSNTIALTWDWLWTWWEVFGGRGRELNVLVIRDEHQIVAIAPLLKREIQRYSVLPFTRLEFLASGEAEQEEICSEYLDFIVRRGCEAESTESLAGYLRDHGEDWDEILLAAMPGNSPNLPLINQNADPESLRVQTASTDLALYLELPDTYSSFVDRLGPSLKREIRKDRRILVARGYRFRVIDNPAEFEEGFGILTRLHQLRWTSRGEPGVFSNSNFRTFHESLAGRLLPKGRLKLFVLEVAGEPIAALMAFTYERRVLLYQSGFLAGSRVLFHPGSAIRDLAIEWSIGEGYAEWDFMKAQPGSYKYRWTSQGREIKTVRMSRSHSKETIHCAASRVIDGLKHIRRALT